MTDEIKTFSDLMKDNQRRPGTKKVKNESKAEAMTPKSVKPPKEFVSAPKSISRNLPKLNLNLIGLIVVLVVVVGVFLIANYRISKVGSDSAKPTQELQSQLEAMKTQLSDLTQKATDLEQQTETNKEAVIDIFDKSRTIPRVLNLTDWNKVDAASLSFTVNFPKTWEITVPATLPTPEGTTEATTKAEQLYLQPAGDQNFISAVTIKTDLTDFAKLPLEEKRKVVADLQIIDAYKYDGGEMLYYINQEKNGLETPTILILTPDNIYRATFNVADKKLPHYFEYRKDFEKIAASFVSTVKQATGKTE